MVHYLSEWPGRIKSDRVMKNSAPETTGYEHFKKQNGPGSEKIPLMIIRKTLHHFQVLILLNILELQL